MSTGVNYKFRRLVAASASLVLFAFTFTILYSLAFHFKKTTRTHCNVPNYLPSLSAAFSHSPQITVWRAVIFLHTPLRFLIGLAYYRLYKTVFRQCRWRICIFLLSLENTSLLLLSFISSRHHHTAHRNAFTLFLISSELYVIFSLFLWKSREAHFTSLQKYSYRVKMYAALVHILSAVSATYFYHRHTSHCEPLMYTWFCLSEYVVVFSNIVFHFTAYYDFYSQPITINTAVLPNFIKQKVFINRGEGLPWSA